VTETNIVQKFSVYIYFEAWHHREATDLGHELIISE